MGFLFSQLADFSHRIEPLRSMLWTWVGLLFAATRLGLASGNGRTQDNGLRQDNGRRQEGSR